MIFNFSLLICITARLVSYRNKTLTQNQIIRAAFYSFPSLWHPLNFSVAYPHVAHFGALWWRFKTQRDGTRVCINLVRLTIIFQTRVHDVSQTADEKLQHDAEMAAPGDIELWVPDVPQHHCRSVWNARVQYGRARAASVRLYTYIYYYTSKTVVVNARAASHAVW